MEICAMECPPKFGQRSYCYAAHDPSCFPETVLAAGFKRRIERRALRYYRFLDEEENRHENPCRCCIREGEAAPDHRGRPRRPKGRGGSGRGEGDRDLPYRRVHAVRRGPRRALSC